MQLMELSPWHELSRVVLLEYMNAVYARQLAV